MDLAEALILVLSFPVLGIVLAALTILEKRLPGALETSPEYWPGTEEPVPPQPLSAAFSSTLPAAAPAAPDHGGTGGLQPPAARQRDRAPQEELPLVCLGYSRYGRHASARNLPVAGRENRRVGGAAPVREHRLSRARNAGQR